jgi:hypothetical protein
MTVFAHVVGALTASDIPHVTGEWQMVSPRVICDIGSHQANSYCGEQEKGGDRRDRYRYG